MKHTFLKDIITQGRGALCRFYLAMISAALGTGVALIMAHDKTYRHDTYLYKLLMTAVLGFLLLTALQLLWEKIRGTRLVQVLLMGSAMLFLAVYYFLLPDTFECAHGEFIIRFVLFSIAFLLAITFTPFISRGITLNSFWQYNKGLFIRLFFTAVFMGILYLGLVLALASIENLFDINIYNELYLELFIFIVGMLATTFFLAGIPADIQTASSAIDYPKGIKVFSGYILTPLLAIYAAILLMYSGKVLITGVWPRGTMTYLVFVFSFLGIGTYVLQYPLVQLKNVWMKYFEKVVFILIIPFSGMLFYAIYLRITEYGLTEPRYYVVVLGLWFLSMSAYYLISKRKDIRVIPITLFVIALVSSFGPWGGIALSEASQLSRLKEILIRNDLLVDHKMIPAKDAAVSYGDLGTISGVLDYLGSVHGFDGIQPWFDADLAQRPGSKKEAYGLCRRNSIRIMKLMNLRYISRWNRQRDVRPERPRLVRLTSRKDAARDIEGYTYLVAFHVNGNETHNFKAGNRNYAASLKGTILTVNATHPKRNVGRIDLGALIKGIEQDMHLTTSVSMNHEDMSFSDGGIKLTLINANVKREHDTYAVDSIYGYLMVK